mgnify:FL=1
MKIRADMILRQLQKRHFKRNDVFLTQVKNGRSWGSENLLIMDALAIRRSWTRPCYIGYEVKISRSDFVRDEKWPGYLQYCHEFYFACPVGLISPEELPKQVGLIYYDPQKDSIVTKRRALYRPIEISSEMLMYIIMSKFDDDRHPFFSDQREMLEAWVEDKKSRKELGNKVKSKLMQEIRMMKEQNQELKRIVGDVEVYKNIEEVLLNHGFSPWNRERWPKDLDKALSVSMSPEVVSDINRLSQLVERLRKAVS